MRVRLFLLVSLFCQAVYAAEPAGMILYKSSPESPDETARAIEFSKAERFAQVTNYVPLEGGSSIRLFNNQLVALIFYPKIEGQTISSPEQIALLRGTAEQMKMTATKFPTTLERLTPSYRAVQAALAEIDSGKVLIAGEWKDKAMIGAPTSAGETLTVKLPDGTEREYTGVRITGKNIDSLKIMHSGGAATIPYEQLSEELQKQQGFDPAEIAKFREQQAAAQKMAQTEPAAKAGGSSPLDGFLARIGPGFSNHDRDSSEKKQFFSEIESLKTFHGSSTFEKGTTYFIDALARQAFFIQQRLDGTLLINDIQQRPCAILLCEPESLLEGKKLDRGARGWAVGEYSGDIEVVMTSGEPRSFPSFKISILCFPTDEGFGFLNFSQPE